MPNLLATLGQQYEIIAGTGIAENYTATFDGSTTGAVGNLKLFKVTGVVAIKIYPQVLQNLNSQGGTLALGTATLTTGIVTTTNASSLNGNKSWIASPAALAADTATNFPTVVTNEDIILTIATASIRGGVISFTAIWKPLTSDASVTAYVAGASISPSLSPSSSASASLSPSASVSRSLSPSNSASPSSSASPSASASPSQSPSSSASASLSPSASASRSQSPSSSASASLSPSASVSRSLSPSSSASASLSPSASISQSLSPSSSVSPSASQSTVL